MSPLTAMAILSFLANQTPDGYRQVHPPSAEGALAPRLVADGDSVLLSWLEPMEVREHDAGRSHRLRLSAWRDGKWSAPTTIVHSDAMFANWADLPSVLRAPDGALVAHWLRKSGPGTYAYDVALVGSRDDGVTWRALGSPHRDRTETEHGFVSMVRDGDAARAFWLDGREMSGGNGHGHEHGDGDMALRTAIVHPAVGTSRVLDDRVCECCNTAAAMTSRGPVIVYRDRSDDEVRDIFIVRRVGDEWTMPKAVHHDGWEIIGCPVNGPALAARDAELVVAWFTAPGGSGSVRAAFSTDGGARFGPALEVDDDGPLGRVDVLLLKAGEAVVSWLDSEEGGRGAVRIRRLSAQGRMGPAKTVAATGSSRAVGFPKIARAGDYLLVVWTEDAGQTSLRAVTLPISAIPGIS